jgi:HlyD family secretion protein
MNFIKSIFKFIFRAKVLIPLVLLAVAAAGYVQYQKKAAETKADRYRTAAVDRGPVIQRISANGTLNPVTVVNVGTQVSGTVTKLYTDFNKPVKANQILLELDPALIKANLAQIEASAFGRSHHAPCRKHTEA